MNILIAGGFGYLGARLAVFLSHAGHVVYLGTRVKQPSPIWLPSARVIVMQWSSDLDLERACDRMDVVIHVAGVNAKNCAADPAAALDFNAVCTERLLQAAIKQNVKQFVYFSTAHVYMSPLEGVITERTIPTNLHPYALSHKLGEDAVCLAHQRGTIDGIVVRLSNAFGAPVHKNVDCWMLLVNELCRQAIKFGHLTLHSSGLQRRDFIPITDVCRAIEHLIGLTKRDRSMFLFNLGGQWSPTILEMAALIQQRCDAILDFKPSLSYIPSNALEKSTALQYKITLLLGTHFTPKGDYETEVDQLLLFCKANFQLEDIV